MQWARIQRLLENRLQVVQDFRFGQAQMQAAHHQAIEDGKLNSLAQEQRLMEQQGQHRLQVRIHFILRSLQWWQVWVVTVCRDIFGWKLINKACHLVKISLDSELYTRATCCS